MVKGLDWLLKALGDDLKIGWSWNFDYTGYKRKDPKMGAERDHRSLSEEEGKPADKGDSLGRSKDGG